MLLMYLLEAIDRALDDKVYRRKLVIRAVEDCIILFRLCLIIAGFCGAAVLILRLLGME